MKRIGITGLAIGLMVLLVGGCSSDKDVQRLVVPFGDASVEIELHNLQVATADGTTTVTGEMRSELSDSYAIEAIIRSPREVDFRLDNGAELSHTIALTDRGFEIEFIRPIWERSHRVNFETPALMGEWLQARVESGEANCSGMPVRMQDMPLQYISESILEHLVSSQGVEIDMAYQHQMLCSLAAFLEVSEAEFPVGVAGWNALRDGQYLPTNFRAPEGASARGEKNNCARATAEGKITADFTTTEQMIYTPNIDVECNPAMLEVDCACCVDESLEPAKATTLQKLSIPSHPMCTGDSKYAQFYFFGKSTVCPSASNSCWPNGVRDLAAPFECTIRNFINADGNPGETYLGGDAISQSGTSAAAYLRFMDRNCIEDAGNGLDQVLINIRSVDTFHDAAEICRYDMVGGDANCLCGAGI